LIERTVDIYGVLPFTDVLITDYSSILYDYILMPDKQVILYLYDYNEYVKERDFYYPFDENVVGKKVDSLETLVEVINKQDYVMEEQERQRILDRFWGDTMKLDSSKAILERVLCEA
jgi:CDP-glycerol glycerophosphotransferase (TagB/SpsB family)